MAVVSVLSSIVLGLLAGYYRRLDAVIMRLMDGLMAIPSVLLAMALMALLGGSVQNVIIALCVVETPRAVRVVRSSVLSIREEMFVDAAHALGVPPIRVLRMHILPNTFAPLIVQASFIAASAVLVEAYLSFVGAGPPPEVPSWGNIMAEGTALHLQVCVDDRLPRHLPHVNCSRHQSRGRWSAGQPGS